MENTLITIKQLVSEAQCYEVIRKLRWQEQVSCPHCDSREIIKRGYHDNQTHRQRYECKACQKRFDDLSETVLAGHHQPFSVWILCLYFMGLNLSNAQIARELDLNKDDVQFMTEHLRIGITKKNSLLF
jgi:transposase-like protein